MPPRTRLAAIALPLALTLACTTVRAPASAIDPTVAVLGGRAEPQLELWVESSSDVGPDVLAQATEDARRALRRAVTERQVAASDEVLVVRAQAVSRTASRRADQRAAVAGMVVGAVVVAAIVVLAVASGKGGGGHGPRAGSIGHGAGGKVAAPIVAPRGAVPAVLPHAVRVSAPRPAAPPVMVWAVGPVGPLPDPGLAAEPPPPGPTFVPPPPGPAWHAGEPPPAGPPAPGAAPDVVTVTLPPPAPLDVERRGFFAKDLLRLELLVLDARDGTVRAAKTVTSEVDVRDAAAVRGALAAALDDASGWAPWR